MSQHDFDIANQTFPSFRSDLNDALQAAATTSAGATAPTTAYAHQLWYDTANGKYMIRNAGNTDWVDAPVGGDLVDDTTPQLGGSLDLNGNDITGTGDIDISGNVTVGSGITSFLNSVRVISTLGDNPAYTSSSSPEGLELNADHLVVVRNDQNLVFLNRTGPDGPLVQFYAQGNKEGTISVSGGTVSYGGGHLSRWSQLADNTRDTSIVKGTVLTNLDQMAVWTNDGVTEDNEQLNCMAVSSVEGDPNVAGVFVNWDNDDDIYHNDMNIAMTGDMVIRIASGTTVARGDLLMSAGDGTAKPQGDDIVRSKTIAKVTSTNVSHTYDDGSYLVPCVLMAC